MNRYHTTISMVLALLCTTSAKPTDPMQESAKHLLNVTENSIYSPSPATPKNQWEYARVAATYPNDAGMYPLLAGDAQIIGDSPQYSYDHDIIQGWNNPNDSLQWQLGPAKFHATYDVYAHYKGHGNFIGNTFAVKIGTKQLRAKVEDTSGKFKGLKIGSISLNRGDTPTVQLSVTKLNATAELFDFKALEIVPNKSQHRWFDPARSTWRTDIPSYLRYGAKTPDTAPPAHLIKDGPKGYAIVTTEAITQNSKELAHFIAHKNSLGYNAFTVTEKDFGGGKGIDAFHNIRTWLRSNYQKREIFYVLFIGNPRPDSGDIPMAAIETDVTEVKKKVAAGEHVHAGRPSDFLYMDLDGPNVDLNKDNKYGGKDDYHATDGINTVWDVLVGRIPYYGEDSKWGKYTDLDAILRKTINYENATYAELLERYQFEVDGFTMSGHLVEWGGFTYYTREQLYSGLLTLDHFSWQNNSFMDQFATGVLRSGGHANPTFIESGVTSGWLANRVPPKDTLNVVAEYGGCDCGQPEHPMNMVYMHLRKGAITAIGATRSIASVGSHGPLVRPNTFSNIRSTSLVRGHSIGQIHWTALARNRRIPNGGAHLWNLYGDPSIVPYPQALSPKRALTVFPSHDIRHYHQQGTAPAESFHFDYDIHNPLDFAQNYSITCKQDWVSIKESRSGSIPAGSKLTLHTAFNARAYQLPAGTHKAQFETKVGPNQITRTIEFTVYSPTTTRNLTFAEQNEGLLIPSKMEKKQYPLYSGERRSIFPNLVDRTLCLEVMPDGQITGNTTLLQGNGFKLHVNPSDQALHLSWTPHPFGDYAWNYRYYDINLDGSNTLKINGRNPLKAKQWNQITLVRGYSNKRLALYLNGELEGHCPLPPMLYDLYRAHIPAGINAAIDNVTAHLGAWQPNSIASHYKQGFPVSAPSPNNKQVGASRQATLTWQMPESHRSFHDPTYYVYMSPNVKDVAAKRPDKRFIMGKTTDTQLSVKGNLKANTTYFWKVYAVSPDRKSIKGGDIWSFTTGSKISEQLLASNHFNAGHSWTRGKITDKAIAEFKTNGDAIVQEIDKNKLSGGYYKLTFHAKTHERKPTKPILLSFLGDGKEIFTHTVELNHLVDDQLEDYFSFDQSVAHFKKIEMKIALPGNGGRCPYWVFATKVELHNNIDPSSIPNRRPEFIEKDTELPPLKVKDNSYAYEFKKIISDEKPDSLVFRKIEGPNWVSVQSSGRIFSYYGAPAEAIGKHRLIVEATDDKGLSTRATFTLVVE
ncbi:hypothetical protein [Rubritalea tangerina]|uniref:Fibronectin type-III domain-containing protein n=1 Tax=Rubritalea tangerina TaxID=430798 RepID=A0ABW4ZFR4_9BACT